jgi:hypothetical protein
MSTTTSADSHQGEIVCDRGLRAFLDGLESDSSLFQPEQLHERLAALDDLDARFGWFDSHESTPRRAKVLQTRLEAANTELYRSVRSEIVRGGRPRTFLQWLQRSAKQDASESRLPGLGFDWRDELVSGVLQLREPSEPDRHGSLEMVRYQPTPARHILRLIGTAALSHDDVFVDLGSGLGHVPLLVSMLTGVRSLGIEVQHAYVASAQECAQSLHLSHVRFIQEDVREADLSCGTVFYLYSPFTGSILTDVLSTLRMESTFRSIKICSLGPCTHTVANETWLKASAQSDPEHITVFDSQ